MKKFQTAREAGDSAVIGDRPDTEANAVIASLMLIMEGHSSSSNAYEISPWHRCFQLSVWRNQRRNSAVQNSTVYPLRSIDDSQVGREAA